jgi:hypothetical protein
MAYDRRYRSDLTSVKEILEKINNVYYRWENIYIYTGIYIKPCVDYEVINFSCSFKARWDSSTFFTIKF